MIGNTKIFTLSIKPARTSHLIEDEVCGPVLRNFPELEGEEKLGSLQPYNEVYGPILEKMIAYQNTIRGRIPVNR